MRKTMQKALSLCMAAIMLVGVTTGAMAAEDVKLPNLTIKNVESRSTVVIGESFMFDGSVFNKGESEPVYNVKPGAIVDTAGSENVHIRAFKLKGGQLYEFFPYEQDQFGIYKRDFTYDRGAGEKINSVKLLTEGYYIVKSWKSDEKYLNNVIIHVMADTSANPTASKVLVDGKDTAFDAYSIDDNNYFKLRDVAQIVSGSGKQFEVTYDNATRAINMISGKAYTAVGGEMAKGDGTAKSATTNTAVIYKDGVEVKLTAYTIGGNNYFKLRDLGQAFNFDVSWDGAKNTVVIDTTASYTAD